VELLGTVLVLVVGNTVTVWTGSQTDSFIQKISETDINSFWSKTDSFAGRDSSRETGTERSKHKTQQAADRADNAELPIVNHHNQK